MKSVVLMCALVVAASSFAHASHYRLPLPQLIEADETEILKRVGIKTTLALLDRVAKRAGRLRLAKVTKLPLERLDLLATQVDLLRIEGIGPSMVLVLQAAGFRHTADLAATNASALLDKMSEANERHRIAPVLPREPSLHDWILQARALPQLLEAPVK